MPQCIIDMNSVLEVTPAEDITGHPHSIALTAPDGVHFVKGMGSEESRWWCDVLSVFVRSKVKHNATIIHSFSSKFKNFNFSLIDLSLKNPVTLLLIVEIVVKKFESCHNLKFRYKTCFLWVLKKLKRAMSSLI